MSAGFDTSRSPAGNTATSGTGTTGQGGGGAGAGASRGGTGQGGDTQDLGAIATDIAGTAAEKGRVLLDSAKGQAVSFADQRKDSAAQSIADIAASLRDTGGGFEDRPNLKAFVGSAADGLEQLSTSLKDRSFADIYGDVESYARRQPMVFGAVAAFAGFLVARFIKSSAEDLSGKTTARTGSQRQRTASAGRRV